jgi:hypothetical protein
MHQPKEFILIVACALVQALSLCAQPRSKEAADSPANDGKSLHFALLTCTPGTDAYAHFGHTAIMMTDEASGQAVVYNYGCFDSSQDHFVWNFVKGDTNYKLEEEPLDYFLWRYSETGNGVTRQQLNLTPTEALRLRQLLARNLQPANQTYLYNWLYDNCTERARDIIAEATLGDIVYTKGDTMTTVRQMLHEKLTQAPWLRLGIDLVLGSEIDRPADRHTRMFLPDSYMAELSQAYIRQPGTKSRPLVAYTSQLLTERDPGREVAGLLTPTVAFMLLLAAVAAISARDIRRHRPTLWLDVVLSIMQSLAGAILIFLFCCSKHPATKANSQIALFMPTIFIYIAMLCRHLQSKLTQGTPAAITQTAPAWTNVALLATFAVLTLALHQSINPAVWLIALTLLTRAATTILTCRKA